MKTKLILSALLFSTFTFFGCGNEKPNYTGYWKGEADMIFEVFTENNIDYTIRNVNGDLTTKYEDNALRGKNSLNMDILMRVKGDSAYYEFGEIKIPGLQVWGFAIMRLGMCGSSRTQG